LLRLVEGFNDQSLGANQNWSGCCSEEEGESASRPSSGLIGNNPMDMSQNEERGDCMLLAVLF